MAAQAMSGSRLRIYAYAPAYPSVYKPYYDAQFVDLLRKGHDVRIFARSAPGGEVGHKVIEYGLDARTSYFFPGEMSKLPLHSPRIVRAFLRHPIRRSRAMRALIARKHRGRRLLAGFARLLTLPTEAPDLCFVHGIRTLGMLYPLGAMYPGVPVALYYHGGEPLEAGVLSPAQARGAFALADVVFTNTEFSRAEAVARGADPAHTHVLPVGFDLDDYQPPEPRRYRRDGHLRLLSVGRLSEGKGYRFALEAVARLIDRGVRDFSYAIIGDGPQRQELQALAASLDIGSLVEFKGALPTGDVSAEYSRADALLLTSVRLPNWAETQAAVVQEALLMKALVVTTTEGGVPESIPPVMRPLAVPPGDADALAAAILRVAELTPDEMHDLGEQGRAWAAAKYDVRVLNDEMLRRVFEDAASGADSVRSTREAAPGIVGARA